MKKTNKLLQLQGLRAIGCFIVVASHFGFIGNGGIGNVIFFVLAGFLFVKPFLNHDFEFKSLRDLGVYYIKKIIGLYLPYCILVVTLRLVFGNQTIVTCNWTHVWQSLVLYKCSVHLWFMQQILILYLIAPAFIYLHMLLKKFIKWRFLNLGYGVLLIGLAIICYYFLTPDVFHLYRNGLPCKFMPELFLIGMAFGYFFTLISHNNIQLSKTTQNIISVIPLIVIVFCFIINFVVKAIWPSSNITIGWNYMLACSIVIAIMIFLLTLVSDSFLAKILGCKPLATIGDVSFTIYIIHPWFLPFLTLTPAYVNTLLVFVISFALAFLFHKYILFYINQFADKYIYKKLLDEVPRQSKDVQE